MAMLRNLILSAAAGLLRAAHVRARERYLSTGDVHWHELSLACMIAEAKIRIAINQLAERR